MKYGECNINIAYQASLGVNDGDVIYIDTWINELYNHLIKKYNVYAK